MAKHARKPCASCPFLPTNFTEFGAVAKRLSVIMGQHDPDFFQQLDIREKVQTDFLASDAALCHTHALDERFKPNGKQVHCAGAELCKKGKLKRLTLPANRHTHSA